MTIVIFFLFLPSFCLFFTVLYIIYSITYLFSYGVQR